MKLKLESDADELFEGLGKHDVTDVVDNDRPNVAPLLTQFLTSPR
jgi:hypothetical protein